jgi:3-oxoacyl-[acyl-carrier-protein] synthase-3
VPGAVITGWGIGVPDKIVTNEDLSATLDTSDAWITERTGIRQRHIGGTTSELAIIAGRQALERAGREPGEIDLLVLATTTPDAVVPGTSATVQDALGTGGGAFDLNAACSGFVYALVAAHGMVLAGARRVLVIGADTLSRITDWDDRTLAVIVGDGAGAVVLEATDGPGQLLAWDLGADGALRHLLKCDTGGYLFMNGREIFRHAVRAVVDSSLAALNRAGMEPSDVDVFVPHQANARIISAAR